MKQGLGRSILALALTSALGAAVPASAALTVFTTYTGNVGLSTDGWGSSESPSGTISAEVPAGATVLAAYLYSATWNFDAPVAPTATLNGDAVAFGPVVTNGTACCNLSSARADVTSIVAPVINGGGGGVYDFTVAEGSTGSQDGEALVVIYTLASLPTATVGILDGWASVDGDTATMTFSSPLDPTASGFVADMRLGINFSCGPADGCSNQSSTVAVNGTQITANAGNHDDSTDFGAFNGGLITVGGFDDPDSTLLPTYANDHERYNLTPYINAGDTSITIRTANASRDDNIFLATFNVTGDATISTNVPEPGSLTLLGLGVAGLARRFSGRRRRL